jgi:hypothetical protein
MADSFSAIADDVSAAFYNPAGLTQMKGPQLSGGHTSYFEGINYEALNFAVPIDKHEFYSRHVLAISVYQLSVSNIERRVADTTDPIGTFNSSDGAYALSYARAFDRRLSLGLSGKYITRRLAGYNSSAYGFDAGLLYHLNPDGARPVNVAVTVRNVGTGTGYVSGYSDSLPTSATLGLGLHAVPKVLKLNLDLSKARDQNAFIAAGGEFTRTFGDSGVGGAMRFGYSTERRDTPGFNGLALGAGVSFYRASFDFAWMPFGILGNTFRYSLLVKF